MSSKYLKEVVESDLFRYFGKISLKSFIFALLKIPGFRFTFFFRLSSFFSKKNPVYYLNQLLYRRYFFKYGIQIPISTTIGRGFYIGHFGNIVINGQVKIGDNCNISNGVTIGQTNRGDKAGVPTIGNLVWIGVNSVIVGKIKIGNNVLVAPNSFVNTDVPDNSIVIGNPAKIIKKISATQGYINNKS
jgi:serine O-acetyltransferase